MILVSAVVLAYGEDPWLKSCVESLLKSTGVALEVIVVDNGCYGGAESRLGQLQDVRIVRPGSNLGFAGGCNFGARHARGEVIAFVNGDATTEPDALSSLAEVARRPGVGLATASIRLADQPDRLNSGGNEIHFLGYGWSGQFGRAASDFPAERDVTGASGAAFAIRGDLWNEMGGFDDRFFAYHEDAELSIRCWQRGLRVVYVPAAIVRHHYEFSRNPKKLYLLERNRLVFLLTLYERRTLLVLAPALIATEIAVIVASLAQGWAMQKWRGYAWLLRNRSWVVARRRLLQSQRTRTDAQIADRLTAHLTVGNYPVPTPVQGLDRIMTLYWRCARRFLRG